MVESARVTELRRRLESDPGSLAFGSLAEELRRQGNLEEAISICRAGLDRHPGFLSGHMTLGRALSATGDDAGATAAFESVLSVAPDNLLASRLLADMYEKEGRLEEAKLCLEKAERYTVKEPTIGVRIADLAKRLQANDTPAPTAALSAPHGAWGRNAKDAPTEHFDAPATFILPDFESLAAPEPTPGEAADFATPTLGHLYLQQGAPEEAANAFRAVLDREPENPRALAGLDSMAAGPALIHAQIARLEQWLRAAQSLRRV
jgi:tetratricopeptide (TPR) repeat protein